MGLLEACYCRESGRDYLGQEQHPCCLGFGLRWHLYLLKKVSDFVLRILSIQLLLLVATVGFSFVVSAIEHVIKSTAGKLLEFLFLVLNLVMLVYDYHCCFFPVVYNYQLSDFEKKNNKIRFQVWLINH